MAKYQVRVAPDALADISDIADFYADLVDEASARRFIDDAFRTIASLDTLPESNAYFDEALKVRRVRVRNHRVSVVYTIDNGVCEVVAFGAFHTAGKPSHYTEAIVERLKELE